jgi:cytidine deaminase
MTIKTIAAKKATQSICRYKVSAIGFNKKGEIIHSSTNKPRFDRKGGGIHAEMEVMLKAGPALRTIVICRVNNAGDILPIEPCDMCQEKANELGIKIVSIKE